MSNNMLLHEQDHANCYSHTVVETNPLPNSSLLLL